MRLDERSLPDYLRRRGLLAADEPARVEPAGDGNINWVRRVRSGDRSFVVKQARSALERFPQYQASTERIVFEARWLETVRPLDRDGVCPRVVAFDEPSRVLVLEDLGDAARLDTVLAGPAVDGEPAGGVWETAREAAVRLAGFLGTVHAVTTDPALAARFANDEMRRLHGDHVFLLPFEPNDFPLPTAVRARAERLWGDARLRSIAAAAYRRYLEPHGALVHADVQAGNVLLAPRGAVLLDAEIAHVGDPAFDLGTLLGHLWLPAAARGTPERAEHAVDSAWSAYRLAAAAGPVLREEAIRYAALEMLRRTVGAARVAAVEDPAAALRVVDFATALLGR
jgi:5-methylthioribose kinase